jgi:hydrogenase small subunit
MGCTEQGIVFNVPIHTNMAIEKPTAPMAYPSVGSIKGDVSAIAAGVGGLVVGAVAGAGYVASRKLTVQVRKAEGEEKEKAP